MSRSVPRTFRTLRGRSNLIFALKLACISLRRLRPLLHKELSTAAESGISTNFLSSSSPYGAGDEKLLGIVVEA
eukprot:1122791-Amphidinium_carterae.2